MNIISPAADFPSCKLEIDEFAKDAIALFTGQKQGHMGKWEYAPSLYPGDPAGGGDFWADLVCYPGQYYLTLSDIETITYATQQHKLIALVSDIESVIELGPGSHEAITEKTIPFLNILPRLKQYIALDATHEQAANAAHIVKNACGIETGMRSHDYYSTPITPVAHNKCAMVMWGSSLGNMSGGPNINPIPHLIDMLRHLKTGLRSGDLLIICADTEQNEKRILQAYSEPSLSASILSVIHCLKRDGYATGNFDPRVWNHEPVWFPQAGQCAHMIYPMFDQTLNIAGHTIPIPAWRRFLSNNSYKFTQETLTKAATHAGFNTPVFFQTGSITLFACQKK